MPRRFPDEPLPEQRVASAGFTRLLVLAFGVAAAVGLLCGVAWVLWHLLGVR